MNAAMDAAVSRGTGLIVDTDINGVNDDAFALHYLITKQYILSMITTCSGNTLASDSLDDARALSASYGIELDSQAGPNNPGGWTPAIHEYHRTLRKELGDSVHLGELGSARTHDVAAGGDRTIRRTVGRTIYYALAAPEVDYLALGPLGNLRDALESGALAAERIRHLVVSGGAFGVPGNVGLVAEFNILADPLAAAEVFAAPIARVTVVPLDVTTELTYGWQEYSRIASGAGPFGWELAKTKGSVFRTHPDFREPLWDLVVAMVMTNPEIVTRSVRGEVSVDTSTTDSPTSSLGATRLRPSEHGHVTVVTEVDADLVLREWTRAFGGVEK